MNKEKHDILTYNGIIWTDWQKTGFSQKEVVDWGIFTSNAHTTKIDLGFEYTNVKYLEQSGEFVVDGRPMTQQEILLCKQFLDGIIVPLQWYKLVVANFCIKYLNNTGWYVERLQDPTSGKAIPDDVISKRAAARQIMDQLDLTESFERVDELRVLALETVGKCDSCGNEK